jgi:ubiquinone/menaquinone biosynthesis C-methylase UbiE
MLNRPAQDDPLRKQYVTAGNLTARNHLHARFSTNPYRWFKWVFDHISLPESCSILELGCGPAWLWQENLKRIPSGWKIVLSDLSPGMIHTARNNLLNVETSASLDFDFNVCSANTTPFENETFDAVIANHMLYHVRNRPEAMTEIYRVLKSGGNFFCCHQWKRSSSRN